MRCFLSLFLVLGLAMTAAGETILYVSLPMEEKIQIYRLNPSDGTLTEVEAVAVGGAPGATFVDPTKKHLFASIRSNSSLASFDINAATGRLKPRSSASLVKGENAAHVSTDRSGRYLLSASYMGGKVVAHSIKDGTIVSPPLQSITTTRTAHMIALDPGNQWVFVPHVEPNAVFQFKLDANSGKLTEAGKAAGGAPKAGPRHLAFHPKLPLAFTSDETGSSITAYRFDAAKGLEPVQTLSTLPADFKTKNTTAEVKVHPSGKFVWVSNRGHDSLAGFAIGADGKLTSLGQTPTEKTPRSFEIESTGQYLFGGGEGSGKIAIYRVNQETGALTRIHTVDAGKSVSWILAVSW